MRYEALLVRCNPYYAETYEDDLCLLTDIQDHWLPEWGIFLIEEGSEADEWIDQGMYFEDKVEAMTKAEEMNRA